MEKKQQGNDFPKLANPARRALANAKISKLKDLTKWSEKDIKVLHGIGPNALKQLKNALKKAGKSFK